MEISIEEMNTKSDWNQVQKLLENTPMSSSIPLAAARPGEFLRAYPVLNGETIDLVARADGKIVGFIHGRKEKKMAFRDGNWSEVDFVYMGDFRVDHSMRRLGIASKLGWGIKNYCRNRNLNYGWGLVVAGNHKMFTFYKQFSKNVQTICEYTVASRLIMAKPRKAREWSYEKFSPSESDFELLAKKLGQRFLGSVVSGSAIGQLYKKYPEICFYRRKDQGDISFAIWNQSQFKQLLLIKIPLPIKFIRWFWNFIRIFTGAHRFPKAGQSWNSAELSMLVDTNLNEDFEKFIVKEAFGMGCHTLNFIEKGLGGNSARIRMKGPAYRLDLNLMSYALDDGEPLMPPQTATIDIDLAFV